MSGLTRDEIKSMIILNQKEIKKFENQILELTKQNMLLSDEKQWFVEKMETVTYRENRKKVSVQKLVGRVYWNETFYDEDTGDGIVIQRNQVVRVNGEWE